MSDERYEREVKGWRSYAPLIAALVFSLGALYFIATGGRFDYFQTGPAYHPGQTHEERREAIASAWGATPRTSSGNCPTVAALERELPGLRGIDARERDYVAFLRRMEC